jgi:uncharacterized membrane protein
VSDVPPYPTGRLLINSAAAGFVAGSTASVIAAFEVGVVLLEGNWANILDAGRPVLVIATLAGLFGGILYGLLVGILARPIARIPSRRTRRVVYVVLFSLGFVAFAIVGLTTGAPPLRPLAAILVVAAAAVCAWISHPGFDRAPRP